MPGSFSDHSANERTLLAWIRTGIAVTAFGFLVEKFTLFLDYLKLALHQHGKVAGGSGAAVVGVILIALGATSFIFATIRFVAINRALDAKFEPGKYFGLSAIFLGVVLGAVGIFLTIYLALQIP